MKKHEIMIKKKKKEKRKSWELPTRNKTSYTLWANEHLVLTLNKACMLWAYKYITVI